MKECLVEPEITNNEIIFQRRHSRTVTKKHDIPFPHFPSSKNNRNELAKISQTKFNKNFSFHEKNVVDLKKPLSKKKLLNLMENYNDIKKLNSNNMFNANKDIFKRENLLKKIDESTFEKNFNEDLFSEITDSDNINEESFIKKNISLNNNNGYQINKVKTRKIKSDFYLTISILYYSIFLLMVKILNSTKLPEIPSTSVILFLIYFHQLIFSMIFMSIDHIDVLTNFDTKDLYHYLIHIFLENIKLFLIIKGLKNLNILSFILIIYLNPLLTSLIILKQKMEETKKMDKIFVIIGIFVISYQFLFSNKLGTIYTTLLLIMISFTSTRDYKTTINFHVYFLIFGISIIGVSISSLVMGILEGNLNISIAQYMCVFILCFAHFFYFYFIVKYLKRKSDDVRRKIIHGILPIAWMYSYFIFKDRYSLSMYFIAFLSISSHIYGKIKLETMDND